MSARVLDDVLRQLRDRVDLPALIGREVVLKRRGRAWSGLCPLHGERNPSFVVYGRPNPGWLCHGCGARGDAVAWLMTRQGMAFREAVAQLAAEHGLAMPEAAAFAGAPGGRREALPPPPAPATIRARDEADAARATERALRLWHEATALRDGDPVVRYLATRGLAMPACDDLRFHPSLPAPDGQAGRFPAMLALVRAPDGAPVAVHRTYLNAWEAELAAGPVHKAASLRSAKAMLGPVSRAAVRLFPAAEVLGVAEGIETALSAAALHGVPVWAALSAHGVETLELPFDVAEVRIFADRDARGRGIAAAQVAARRWRAEHRAVSIHAPREGGVAKDYNDLLLASREVA